MLSPYLRQVLCHPSARRRSSRTQMADAKKVLPILHIINVGEEYSDLVIRAHPDTMVKSHPFEFVWCVRLDITRAVIFTCLAACQIRTCKCWGWYSTGKDRTHKSHDQGKKSVWLHLEGDLGEVE